MNMTERVEEAFFEMMQMGTSGEILKGPGWLQYINENGFPSNGIYKSQLDESEVDEKIREVKAHYEQLGIRFVWHATPSSRPANLGERLLAHGLDHDLTICAMVRETSLEMSPTSDAIQIEPLEPQDVPVFAKIMCEESGLAEFDHETMCVSLRKVVTSDSNPRRMFLVRYDGDPIGACSLTLLPSLGCLATAVVAKSHRGRGVYRAMIQARMRYLQKRGRELAVVHATATTSAPVCKRVGFRSVCEWELYRSPPLGG